MPARHAPPPPPRQAAEGRRERAGAAPPRARTCPAAAAGQEGRCSCPAGRRRRPLIPSCRGCGGGPADGRRRAPKREGGAPAWAPCAAAAPRSRPGSLPQSPPSARWGRRRSVQRACRPASLRARSRGGCCSPRPRGASPVPFHTSPPAWRRCGRSQRGGPRASVAAGAQSSAAPASASCSGPFPTAAARRKYRSLSAASLRPPM
mmetsp:Transcript_18834/g.72621  ORF Transcript_18834/g.72621 Transcript_18834/m.72621 type:complete len:205 (+) Transcript_18834:85-699(+)